MTGTSLQHAKRGSMTPQRALRIFQARGGVCHCPANDGLRKDYGCGRKLGPRDEWRVEHGRALENGGTDDDDDLFILCDWCWPEKDADDHGQAGHGRRMAVNAFVPKQYRKTGKGWRR